MASIRTNLHQITQAERIAVTRKRSLKNPDVTPNSIIVHALRLLWLHSRERRAALKRDRYTCQDCGRKQSVAKGKEFKVEVDHLTGSIDWAVLADYIRRHLLVSADKLETVCKEDHLKRTELRKQIERGTDGIILRLESLALLDTDRPEVLGSDSDPTRSGSDRPMD